MSVISPRAAVRDFGRELFAFVLKQVCACAFAGPFLLLLVFSKHIHIPGIARYDMLFVGAILIQAALIAVRLENGRDLLRGVGLSASAAWLGVRPERQDRLVDIADHHQLHHRRRAQAALPNACQ